MKFGCENLVMLKVKCKQTREKPDMIILSCSFFPFDAILTVFWVNLSTYFNGFNSKSIFGKPSDLVLEREVLNPFLKESRTTRFLEKKNKDWNCLKIEYILSVSYRNGGVSISVWFFECHFDRKIISEINDKAMSQKSILFFSRKNFSDAMGVCCVNCFLPLMVCMEGKTIDTIESQPNVHVFLFQYQKSKCRLQRRLC